MKRTDGRTFVYHNTSRLKDGRIKTSTVTSHFYCISFSCKLTKVSSSKKLETSMDCNLEALATLMLFHIDVSLFYPFDSQRLDFVKIILSYYRHFYKKSYKATCLFNQSYWRRTINQVSMCNLQTPHLGLCLLIQIVSEIIINF